MSNRIGHEASTSQVLLRAGGPALATWFFIPLAFVQPLVDSTRAPYFDLTQTFSEFVFLVSQSGGKFGVPIVLALMLTFLVTREGITFQRRWGETGVILLVATIFAGGGAALNEHVIKASLKIPRPNIVWLAGENGTGPLGMTPKHFYETGNTQTRREPLREVLKKEPQPVLLSSSIEAHWIEETGYSFPSGHAFTAMFFATFLLALATTYLSTRRRWLFYALLPWALAVCYSRPILRVHTPADITVGGLQGLAVGLLAWAIARTLIRRFS